MEKKALKLAEILQLEAELNGIVNTQTGEKIVSGILSQKLPLKVKYWLNDLSQKVTEQKEQCETLRNELIKKYGEEKDGVITIPFQVKNDAGEFVQNPKFEEFNKEYNELLNIYRDIEYNAISLNDIGNLETEERYDKLFSLLTI